MKDLFFPYYINSGRLLDIYAILNHGYSEYEEITLSSNSEKHKNGKTEGNISAGFKLFNFGFSGLNEKSNTDSKGTQITEKKIQTMPSMLKIVLDTLREREYLKAIEAANEGDFVELDPVTFQINSVKMMMEEIDEIIKLGIETNATKSSSVKKIIADYKKASKPIFDLCNGEEAICDCKNYAIVGNFFEQHLYQGIKSDLINTEFNCLCQVKRKHEKGASLLRNTVFAKIKSKESKEKFIKALQDFCEEDYSFNSVVVSEIKDKPVYEVEIIALYK